MTDDLTDVLRSEMSGSILLRCGEWIATHRPPVPLYYYGHPVAFRIDQGGGEFLTVRAEEIVGVIHV